MKIDFEVYIPMDLEKILSEHGLMEEIYEAMKHADMSKVILTVLNIIKKTLPEDFSLEMEKCADHSAELRNYGNECYSEGNYQGALEMYNDALKSAPANSEELKLAYSNRSALLFQTKAYKACLKDIDTCFSMGCSENIVKKLKKRKENCERHLWEDEVANRIFSSSFNDDYFRFNVKCHPQIPCASAKIDVVLENQLPRVVAVKNIKVGTVLAVETPFVSHLNNCNFDSACYYCHKMSLNLMPCTGCTYALFCDEDCLKQCMKEYHDIECQIMSCLDNLYPAFRVTRLTVKAALKLRKSCQTWKEFIAASQNIGNNRMRNSSINEIFDVNNKFSILNYNGDRHFVHGQMYNNGVMFAIIINTLERITFFPEAPDEKNEAICAFARVMMNLCILFPCTLDIENSAQDIIPRQVTSNTEANYGWFSLTSKLSHCCDANVFAVGLKNKVALIALQPIEKGAELKISHLGHWYEFTHDNDKVLRQIRLFWLSQQTCCCRICSGDWDWRSYGGSKLTQPQRKAYIKWAAVKKKMLMLNRDEKLFTATCEALAALRSAINTKEHAEVFREYRNMLSLFQFVATNNLTLRNGD